MTPGARTPEELDTLLEDAFVLRDSADLGVLFETGAIVATHRDEALGEAAIGRALAALWTSDRTYVAGPQRVLRARDLALVVAAAGIHVLRRGDDATWRVAISLLDLDSTTKEEP